MTGPDGPRLPGRRSGEGRGKRNPGKQPGAPGSYLAWSTDPGRTVPPARDPRQRFANLLQRQHRPDLAP